MAVGMNILATGGCEMFLTGSINSFSDLVIYNYTRDSLT